MTSSFLKTGRTYIEEAAEYLDSRGLPDGVAIYPYKNINHGYLVPTTDGFAPWVPEGWAYKIRASDGDYYEDRFLMRVCNKPEVVYRSRERGEDPVPVDVPKFLHVGPKGADLTHFTSTFQELVNSKVIMLHEKFTSAQLAVNLLGIPSIALSGCTNWSKDRQMRPSIRKVIEQANHDAVIYVCFDADIHSNENVQYAASQLKGWIEGLRPDLTVIFPIVPEMEDGKAGWDDWVVAQGDMAAAAWLTTLQEQGYEVTSAMPVGWLIETFGLAYKATKNEGIEIEHTSDNYLKLLSHPHWKYWGKNIDGSVIHTETLEYATLDHFIMEFEAWLQSNVFRGRGANVRSNMVERAIMRRLDIHKVSAPHLVLEAMPAVTEEEAYHAARLACTEGMKVVGPMSTEETDETLIRVCRDLVGLWAVDPDLSAQWMLALVGPSGCGKSNWIERILACLTDRGVKWQPAEVPKNGSRADPVEYKRLMRDNLVVMLDEYEPDDAIARNLEREFFSLSTKRQDSLRDPYMRTPQPCTLRSGIILTTVESNRTFIRSAKGAGAERRFIVFEVKGVMMGPDGKMTSNRALLEQCGAVLLRYGWQLWQSGSTGSANEFSTKYNDQYISDSNAMNKISANLGRNVDGLEAELLKLGNGWKMKPYKEGEEIIRFTEKQMAAHFAPGAQLTRGDRKDLLRAAVSAGAELVDGVVRLSSNKVARNVLQVPADQWPAFIEELFSQLR